VSTGSTTRQESIDPRLAKLVGAGAVASVLVPVVVAVAVAVVGLWQVPTYEASAHVQVGIPEQSDEQLNLAGSPEGHQALTMTLRYAVDSPPIAEEAIRRPREPSAAEMEPTELLSNLTVERVGVNSIFFTYEDTTPVAAAEIATTFAEVSSERISDTSVDGSELTATLVRRAALPEEPASPHPIRNGLLTLVVGWTLCVGGGFVALVAYRSAHH
jgi:capsular polysaccharide biosynthesis protein